MRPSSQNCTSFMLSYMYCHLFRVVTFTAITFTVCLLYVLHTGLFIKKQKQCWHHSMNIPSLHCQCTALSSPALNYTTPSFVLHSQVHLAKLHLSQLHCSNLFSLAFSLFSFPPPPPEHTGLWDSFLLSLIITVIICVVQTNTDWSHTHVVLSLLSALCPERPIDWLIKISVFATYSSLLRERHVKLLFYD